MPPSERHVLRSRQGGLSAIGAVFCGVCTGLTATLTGGWGITAAGGCFLGGMFVGEAFESLAYRSRR